MGKTNNLLQKWIPTILVIYLVLGLGFAFIYAVYYRWSFFSFFSPGFFNVMFLWPFKVGGVIDHLLRFGLSGPPLGY